MPKKMSILEALFYSMVTIVFFIGIYGFIKLLKFIGNKRYEKGVEKYRKKLSRNLYIVRDYIEGVPPLDIPPAYISLIYIMITKHIKIL